MCVSKHFTDARRLEFLILGTILNNAKGVNPQVAESQIASEADSVLESEWELLLVDLSFPFALLV